MEVCAFVFVRKYVYSLVFVCVDMCMCVCVWVGGEREKCVISIMYA